MWIYRENPERRPHTVQTDIQNKLNPVPDLGLPIYISEYDVARTNDQEQWRLASAYPDVAGSGSTFRLHV